jgi:hypothetical protein
MDVQTGIDPSRLYTFPEAVRLLLNPHTGAPVTAATLHLWRQAGKVRALERSRGKKRDYLIRGSELLRAIATREDLRRWGRRLAG